MGVDRTFNLGECYVTCIAYKNGQMIRKETQEPPLILGYVPWTCIEMEVMRPTTGSFPTSRPSWTTARKLQYPICRWGQIRWRRWWKLWSDAFRNPLYFSVVATRRKTHTVHGVACKIRSVHRKLFGNIYWTDCLDRMGWEVWTTHSRLITCLTKSSASVRTAVFVPYLQSNVIPVIWEKVVEPHRQHNTVPMNWMNNQCEAMNHILKLETSWRLTGNRRR